MVNGITVSQSGVGLEGLDSQKVLDSRWRYWELATEKIISTGQLTDSVTTDLFNHDLNFVPAFSCYNITTGNYIVTGDINGGLRADTKKVYFDGFLPSPDTISNSQLLFRVYNVPITQEYTAPIDKTLPGKTTKPSKFGIKITNKPNGMNSNELSDYTLNTSGKALNIQKTGVVVVTSGTNYQAKIDHFIGYPPIFLLTQVDPQLQWATNFNPDFVPYKSSADVQSITFQGVQAVMQGTFAYIIFKELADFAV